MGGKFSQSGGVFNSGSGDIDVNAEFALSWTGVFTSTSGTLLLGGAYTHDSGGTFNHNNGTVVFDGADFGPLSLAPAGDTFNNVTVNLPDGGQRTLFGVLIAIGSLNLNNGILFGGTLQPQGNVIIANTFDGGSSTAVTFSGSNNQSFTNNGGVNPSGTWTVNKSARALTLASDLTLQPGQQLNITEGILDQGTSFNLVAGSITVGAAGRFQNLGTGDITLLGNVANNGFINLNGSGPTCNDPDTILIRSSIDGTRRMWFGTGSFAIEDVDVKDQEAVLPLTITAFASTNTGNNVNWSFNSNCDPTAVTLESFTATWFDRGMLLEWRTGFESRNLGFNLYRESGGQRKLVNRQLIAGSALTAGSTLRAGQGYTWWDEGACGSGDDECRNTVYWLEDVDLAGRSTWHGPVFSSDRKLAPGKLHSESNARSLNLMNDLLRSDESRRVVNRATMPQADTMSAAVQAGLASENAAKIKVNDEGWYRVSQPELNSVGFDTTVDPRLLQLFVDGRELPIVVQGEQDGKFDAGDSVEFYGIGLESPFSYSRTYWLVAGVSPGQRVRQEVFQGAPGGLQSFTTVIEKREQSIYFARLLNGELENFFGAVIAGDAIEQILTTHHISSSSGAEVEVALQGVTLSEHRVLVEFNGAIVGAIDFYGQTQGSGKYSLGQPYLREGQNTVRLIPLSGPGEVSLVDFIRISYQHTLTADDDNLKLAAAGLQQHTIEGFSSGSIRVVDVTDPNSPQEIIGTIEKRRNGYSIRFASSERGERSLLAFANPGRPAGLSLNMTSNLRTGNGELVIITTRELRESLRPLVGLRRAQGLSVTLVEVEDVYDEFSYGQKTPYAIREFLAYAKANWKKKPRYVLFAGDASYHPKNHFGLGDFDHVSTKLIDTDFMEAASDDSATLMIRPWTRWEKA